jgi:hypothetical protein
MNHHSNSQVREKRQNELKKEVELEVRVGENLKVQNYLRVLHIQSKVCLYVY